MFSETRVDATSNNIFLDKLTSNLVEGKLIAGFDRCVAVKVDGCIVVEVEDCFALELEDSITVEVEVCKAGELEFKLSPSNFLLFIAGSVILTSSVSFLQKTF